MSSHPSTDLLDRFWADDLDATARGAVDEHARACRDCRGYLDELSREDRERLEAVPVDRFVAGLQARRRAPRRRLLGVGATLAALAAAAALVVLAPSAPDRVKGGSVGELIVHRKRGEQVRRLDDGLRIQAGDSLRVSVSLTHAGRAGAWFVDARGRVDPLLPGGTAELRAGEQTLPGGVSVDSPCVGLWLVVAAGDGARDFEARLRRSLAAGAPEREGWLPDGAVARRLECE